MMVLVSLPVSNTHRMAKALSGNIECRSCGACTCHEGVKLTLFCEGSPVTIDFKTSQRL